MDTGFSKSEQEYPKDTVRHLREAIHPRKGADCFFHDIIISAPSEASVHREASTMCIAHGTMEGKKVNGS